MTAEEHLRILIGDLIVKIALLTAENDMLKQQLQQRPEATD
jgi:hypothetical protein